MEDIFYLWAVVEIARIIYVMFKEDDTAGVDEDNPLEVAGYVWSKKSSIILVLTCVWMIVGLFTGMWLLFLLLIMMRIMYQVTYNYTTDKNHTFFWWLDSITNIGVLISILAIHFLFK